MAEILNDYVILESSKALDHPARLHSSPVTKQELDAANAPNLKRGQDRLDSLLPPLAFETKCERPYTVSEQARIDALDNAVEFNPSVNALVSVIKIKESAGHYDDAEDDIKQLADIYKSGNKLANAQFLEKQDVAILRQTLPSLVSHRLSDLGDTEEQMGKYPDAIKTYQEAIAADKQQEAKEAGDSAAPPPKGNTNFQSETIGRIGESYLAAGDLQDAEGPLKEAVKQLAQSDKSIIDLGQLDIDSSALPFVRSVHELQLWYAQTGDATKAGASQKMINDINHRYPSFYLETGTEQQERLSWSSPR